jgi:type I restriction enzyme S subunit
LEEQMAICSSIAAGAHKLDDLSAATARTITLLGERRSALIAAAVTGRIEVPGVAA